MYYWVKTRFTQQYFIYIRYITRLLFFEWIVWSVLLYDTAPNAVRDFLGKEVVGFLIIPMTILENIIVYLFMRPDIYHVTYLESALIILNLK